VSSILGNRVVRVEDPRMLTEGGMYVEDLPFKNAAWVTYVRSPYAHAAITSIDIEDAAAMPGVVAIYTGDDVRELGLAPSVNPAYPEAARRQFIALDKVRYVGQPVVAVVAETRDQAADAAELVFVDYEPLEVLIDVEESLKNEILLFPEVGSNQIARFQTEKAADFSGCEVVVEARIVNQRMTGAPIEPRSGAAYWTEDGRLVHYSACQGGHPTRDFLAEVFGLDKASVRVVVPDVGGGFGAKSRSYPEEAVIGFFARALGRPMRWTETRTENMMAMPHGRGQVQYAKLGGTRDGKITAYQLDVIQDAGAFPMTGAILHRMTMQMATGCYEISNVGFTGVSTLTNASSITAFRGAGRPEATVAIERMVDLFAADIGIDPADVRRKNLVPKFLDPYTTGIGTKYDVGDYPEALDRLLKAADYDGLRAEQARRRAAGGRVAMGIGLSSYVEITAGVPGSEFGSVEVLEGGRLEVKSGTTAFGQGHVTTWKMLIADRTGVPMDQIDVILGDTDKIRSGGLTVGSRSVQLGGAALSNAAATLIEQAKERAAQMLEAAVEDVVFDDDAASFHVAGTPSKALGWAELYVPNEPLFADHDFVAPMPTFPFGAHLAVVDVDLDTGKVTLKRLVAVDDAGFLLSPLLAEGQVHGGIAQGVAQALLESIEYDENGQLKTSNFADYPVISAAELPSFEVIHMETPTWVNPLGAKGVGESGTIGAIPAAYNAVIDALSHLGVRHMETPLTPERVWAELQRHP
jgi:aerobic carbon-monoxide dehydrogenase large subunit